MEALFLVLDVMYSYMVLTALMTVLSMLEELYDMMVGRSKTTLTTKEHFIIGLKWPIEFPKSVIREWRNHNHE